MLEYRKERVSISLYPLTLKLIDEEADKQNRSRSNLIETILRRHLGVESLEEKSSRPLARSFL
jgi:metal-responsive CopG/Arc/MetJ family transcriptional regulator